MFGGPLFAGLAYVAQVALRARTIQPGPLIVVGLVRLSVRLVANPDIEREPYFVVLDRASAIDLICSGVGPPRRVRRS